MSAKPGPKGTMLGGGYHVRLSPISRCGGRKVAHSFVAAVAYACRLIMEELRRKETLAFNDKGDCFATGLVLPPCAPHWLRDIPRLANEIELADTKVNAQPGINMDLAVPYGLSPEEGLAFVSAVVHDIADPLGIAAVYGIHVAEDGHNPHAHVAASTREVNENGIGKKVRGMRGKAFTKKIRAIAAAEGAKALRLAAQMRDNPEEKRQLNLAADRWEWGDKTLPQQGLMALWRGDIEFAEHCAGRKPGIHVGPTANAIERRTKASNKALKNRAIAAENQSRIRGHKRDEILSPVILGKAPAIQAKENRDDPWKRAVAKIQKELVDKIGKQRVDEFLLARGAIRTGDTMTHERKTQNGKTFLYRRRLSEIHRLKYYVLRNWFAPRNELNRKKVNTNAKQRLRETFEDKVKAKRRAASRLFDSGSERASLGSKLVQAFLIGGKSENHLNEFPSASPAHWNRDGARQEASADDAASFGCSQEIDLDDYIQWVMAQLGEAEAIIDADYKHRLKLCGPDERKLLILECQGAKRRMREEAKSLIAWAKHQRLILAKRKDLNPQKKGTSTSF